MKKYEMLVLAFTFIFSFAISAQDQMPPQGEKGPKKEFRQGDRPQMSAQSRAERLAKQLSLTDAEKAKVQALFEKQDADRQKKQAEVQKTREEMKTKFENERKTQDEELAKIIGNEKFQKLQKMRTERLQKMQDRREMRQDNSTGNTSNQ